jgi:hypothetical protein
MLSLPRYEPDCLSEPSDSRCNHLGKLYSRATYLGRYARESVSLVHPFLIPPHLQQEILGRT